MINAVLRLRRDNDYNYAKIKDTFIPQNGEICLVDTARNGLRAVCGDGVTPFGQLDYIGQSFIQGYYHDSLNWFYADANFTRILDGKETVIYLDLQTNSLFYFNGYDFVKIDTSLPTASELIKGVMRLYATTGDNTDGTMTQKAITEELDTVNKELDTKVEVSLKEEDELIIFSL